MLVACLLVQNPVATRTFNGATGHRLAWNRLKEIRGVDRYVVVASPELLESTVRMLKRAGNGPGKYIALPPDGFDNLMKRLTESPLNAIATSGHEYPVDAPLAADDVVIFDRCLSPFATGDALERCLSPEDAKLTCPGQREWGTTRVTGPVKSMLATVPVLNTSLGVYRYTSSGEIAFAEAGRAEMLQMDRPDDMNIAQALELYGTD